MYKVTPDIGGGFRGVTEEDQIAFEKHSEWEKNYASLRDQQEAEAEAEKLRKLALEEQKRVKIGWLDYIIGDIHPDKGLPITDKSNPWEEVDEDGTVVRVLWAYFD